MRALAILAVALCACSVEPAQGVGASSAIDPSAPQPGDVSVMLPLPADEAALASRLGAAELMPQAIYEAAFGPPGTLQAGGTPAAPAHAALRLSAFRLDPCFAALPPVDDAACVRQLRLVLQSYRVKDGAVHADDNAVHAFYRLTRDELYDAVDAMIALRLERGVTALGPLAPHPLAGDPEVSVAIDTLIGALARPDNLTRITLLTSSGLGTAWNFSGVEVEAGSAARMQLVDVPAGSEVVAFFKGFTPDTLSGDPAFTPPSQAPPEDNMQLLGHAGRAAQAPPEARARAFDALLRIEDPAEHTPDTTDCASCHAAEPVRRFVAEPLGLDAGDDLAVDPDSVAPDVNLHMFSYVGRQASIHRRTIHETHAVIAHLAEHLRSAP